MKAKIAVVLALLLSLPMAFARSSRYHHSGQKHYTGNHPSSHARGHYKKHRSHHH